MQVKKMEYLAIIKLLRKFRKIILEENSFVCGDTRARETLEMVTPNKTPWSSIEKIQHSKDVFSYIDFLITISFSEFKNSPS